LKLVFGRFKIRKIKSSCEKESFEFQFKISSKIDFNNNNERFEVKVLLFGVDAPTRSIDCKHYITKIIKAFCYCVIRLVIFFSNY
jgi:hypothetical protein